MNETEIALALNRIEAKMGQLVTCEVDLHELVADARAAGVAWSSIGDRLGITRQAAQQRFGVKPVSGDDLPSGECGRWHP